MQDGYSAATPRALQVYNRRREVLMATFIYGEYVRQDVLNWHWGPSALMHAETAAWVAHHES